MFKRFPSLMFQMEPSFSSDMYEAIKGAFTGTLAQIHADILSCDAPFSNDRFLDMTVKGPERIDFVQSFGPDGIWVVIPVHNENGVHIQDVLVAKMYEGALLEGDVLPILSFGLPVVAIA